MPSGLIISHKTPTCEVRANFARSMVASVWPARVKTPPVRATKGKICPGRLKSDIFVLGLVNSLIVV